jgi:hypothetical protein
MGQKKKGDDCGMVYEIRAKEEHKKKKRKIG